MAQIDGAGQQDTDDQNAEALQAALAQREVTLQGQPQGGSDVPSHENSDPVRRIGNSTALSGSYRKTSQCWQNPRRSGWPEASSDEVGQVWNGGLVWDGEPSAQVVPERHSELLAGFH